MDLTKVALRLKGLPISENETDFVDLINKHFKNIVESEDQGGELFIKLENDIRIVSSTFTKLLYKEHGFIVYEVCGPRIWLLDINELKNR